MSAAIDILMQIVLISVELSVFFVNLSLVKAIESVQIITIFTHFNFISNSMYFVSSY